MAYRKIEPKLWDDELIADLELTTKLVWVYLLTGRHTTSLPGLWVVTAAMISDGLRAPAWLVEKALVELECLGRIVRDKRRRLVRVPKSPKHNPADNARVVKAWWNQWLDLPECALKYEHIASMRDGIDGEKTTAAWDSYFGKVDTVQELARFANRERTGSEPGANDAERGAKGSSVPAPVPVCLDHGSPDPDPSQAGEPASEIPGAREEQPLGHREPPPRPLPPSAGHPPGAKLGPSDRHHRATHPRPAAPTSDDMMVIHDALQAYPALRNIATPELAEEIAAKLLTGPKPLPDVLESIRSAAEKISTRRAGRQIVSDSEAVDIVFGYATKPRPPTGPRVSARSPPSVQPYPESPDAIRARRPSTPIEYGPDGEVRI